MIGGKPDADDERAVEKSGEVILLLRAKNAERRVAGHMDRHESAGDAGDRPERQVDAAGQDDEILAKRNQRQRQRRDAQRAQIEGCKAAP